MANQYFQFKRFTIEQDKCAMKVGTDGVLLGAVVEVNDTIHRVLDVGTGTGLISLMLAQRMEQAEITAIDIDEMAVEQARENAQRSPFAERIKVELSDFRTMVGNESEYDLVVSNPPFFNEKVNCPDSQRDTARHTDSLPLSSLIENAARLLTSEGRFAVIIPTQISADFILDCAMNGLHLYRKTMVKTVPRKEAKRVILEFSKQSVASRVETLLLRDENGENSEEYRKLTEEFYKTHPLTPPIQGGE